MPELDDRKAAILKAVVQDFVRDGEPVGSKRIAGEWNLGVSAATVRTEMVALEEHGYIAQPHTSAGRVPTDKGYRYFVDSLTETAPLQPEQRAALQGLLAGAADLEDLLRRASGVLSRMTKFAALVAAPRLDRSRIRHLELVRLGPHTVLAVTIANTGRVEKRMIDLDRPLADHDVQRVRHSVNEAAVDLLTADAPAVIRGLASGAPPEAVPLIEAVADAVRQGLEDPPMAQVFVGGAANVAGPAFFQRLEEVRHIHEALEEQVVLLRMLREALASGDPAVRIGTEMSFSELAACAVVAAKYDAAGQSTGSIGVLGPSRMDYAGTLSSVRAVAEALEHALAGLTGGGGQQRGA